MTTSAPPATVRVSRAFTVRGFTLGALAARSRARTLDITHPYLADGAIAFALALASAAWVLGHTAGAPAVWGFTAALCAPLVARRLWPVGAFGLLCAIALGQWFATGPLPADASLLVMLFTLALESSRKRVLVAAGALEVGALMASARWALGDSWEASLVGLSGLVAAALLAGALLKGRRAQLAALTERAERLELERDQQARIAAAAERARIAREMHDVVAHSLAVMVTMADGAAAKLRQGPSSALEAVEAISEIGRQALGDTRRLVGVLRQEEGGSGRAPAPGLADLEGLMEQLRGTGLRADLELHGEQFELAAGAALTVYRLVQEAATNTLKHAWGASSFVARIYFDRPRVRVEAVDDGAQATSAPAECTGHEAERAGVGHGISGMRERASLYGGTVHVGSLPGGGGWRVVASLASAGAPARPVHA